MDERKQKVAELMDSFQALHRAKGFRPTGIPDITPSQWGALMVLEARGKSNVKDIATALGISSSATTQLVDGLVASGYVLRSEDASDRRKMVLTISKKSRKQIIKMKEHTTQQFLEFFKVLSNEEFDQFILLHKKVVEGLVKENKII